MSWNDNLTPSSVFWHSFCAKRHPCRETRSSDKDFFWRRRWRCNFHVKGPVKTLQRERPGQAERSRLIHRYRDFTQEKGKIQSFCSHPYAITSLISLLHPCYDLIFSFFCFCARRHPYLQLNRFVSWLTHVCITRRNSYFLSFFSFFL